VAYSTLPRPDALSKYFDCATKVDDHDNARQDKLAVEGAWDTTCPWFRLHTSFVGICFTDMWKLCDAIGILPFHQRADRRMPIKKCLNMFAVRFFLKADHQKCKLKSWDPIFKKGDPLKSNPAKCYKDDQYRKHACYMCKLRIHSSDAKRPIRAFKYCATCNPEGDTRLAICAECFPNHKKQVEYFNVCPPATLPASGARAS
jgi:hypothetical protein